MSRQQRLEYLIRTYPNDLQGHFDKYTRVCQHAGEEEKPFRTDHTLIHNEIISISAIQEAIGEATEEIITRFPELAHESASQTVARLDAHAAAQAERDDHGAFETYDNCICGAHSYLQIWASGADMNDRCGFTLPSGAMAQDCPLPNFGLPDYQHDGFQITLCTKCGRVYKFDTAEVALAIEELEEELAEAE